MGDLFWIHHRKVIAAGVAAAVLLFLSVRGCDGAAETDLSGTVSAAGQPVTWGTVTVVGSDGQVYTTPVRPDGTYRFEKLPAGPTRGLAVTSPSPHDHVGQNPAQVGRTAYGQPLGTPPPRGGKVTVSGAGGYPGGSAGGMAGVVTGGGTSGGGAAGGRGGRSEKKQVFGMDAKTVPPPAISTPQAAPPQIRWVPLPGKYGNPATSGIAPPINPGPNQFDITLD